jgi:hypothetical protein
MSICNDFVGTKHGVQHLNYDLVLIFLLMCSNNKFEHLMNVFF